MDKPYATKVVSGANTIALTNAKLVAGRTYYVKVAFRTRGDGSSTASKCSSVGFITYWDNWAQSRSYIHSSAQAYNERRAFVSWTYSFTVSSDVQPTGTALYFIINNGWANGYDSQTIDLYYAKYWDSAGNVYSEFGEDCGMLNIRQQGGVYQPPVASTTKYTTPSLCFRRGGKTLYIPLAPPPEQSASSTACTIDTPEYSYYIGYQVYSYIMPHMSVRYQGRTYYIPNVCRATPKVTYDIPAGTYTAQQFENYMVTFFGQPWVVQTIKKTVKYDFTYTITGTGSPKSVTASVKAGQYVSSNVGSSSPFNNRQAGFNFTSSVALIRTELFMTYKGTMDNPGWFQNYKAATITITPGIKFN